MTKVDGSLGSLVQGVSQQPQRARLPGQSEEQINVVNDEVFGLSRRPGSTTISTAPRFAADAGGNRYTEHGLVRIGGKTLPYGMRVAKDGNPHMRLLDGSTYHDVWFDPASKAYFDIDWTSKSREETFVFRELGSDVYCLNTQKKVAAKTTLPSFDDTNGTVVYCRGGGYATGFLLDVRINGLNNGTVKVRCAFGTPDGSNSNHGRKAKPRWIMTSLRNLCAVARTGGSGTVAKPSWWPSGVAYDGRYGAGSSAATAALASGGEDWTPGDDQWSSTPGFRELMQHYFTITLLDNHIVFRPKISTLDYKITASTTGSDDLIVGVRDEVESTATLPTRAPVGMVVLIAGAANKDDDYYVQWKVPGRALGSLPNRDGVWKECTKPGEKNELDPATMPQRLAWNATNSRYEVTPFWWEPRGAGSNISNPMPKFVGDKIFDIGDFQGRSYLLHSDEITMSKTQAYRQFFRDSAAVLKDTDRIHMKSTATRGRSTLAYGVPYNRDLIIFGTNNTQFMVSGRSTLTPKTASMTVTSEFDVNLRVRPEAVASSTMFTSYDGKYTQLHEMFLEGSESNHSRRTMSNHVPRYMPGRAILFAADDSANMAAIVTSSSRKTLYVYKYLWLDSRRVQSAWCKWTFKSDIHAVTIKEGIVHLTLKTESGGFVASDINLTRQNATGLPVPLHMDFQKEVTLSNSNTITLTAPSNTMNVADLKVIALTGAGVIGMPLAIDSVAAEAGWNGNNPNSVTITLKAPYTGKVMAGVAMKSKIIPTMPVLRDGDGVAITSKPLTVTSFAVSYDESGPFKMIRECSYEKAADWWTDEYSGRTLGDPDFVLGSLPMDTGIFDFTFADLTTTSRLVLETDHHLPMTVTEIEWEGTIKGRGRRITNGA